MGILLSDQDIRKAIKAGGQDKLLREFQERYSVHFASIVSEIISKQISSFRELQARLSGNQPDKKSEHSHEHFKISPPIDFEGDIFQSLGQTAKKQEDPAAGKGQSDSKKATSQLHGRPNRFLGADGQLVRRSAIESTEEYKLADIHSRINGHAKDQRLHRQASDLVERRSLEEEPIALRTNSGVTNKQRDFWEKDLRLEKAPAVFEKDQAIHTPVIQKKDIFADKPFKSAVHASIEKDPSLYLRNKENHHLAATQNSIEKDSRFETKSVFTSSYKPTGSDIKRVGSSTAESFYLNSFNPHAERASGNTLAKRKSAQEFYSKAPEEQGDARVSGKDKTTIRVSELFNKLNNRFKKYHEEFESASKQVPLDAWSELLGKQDQQASPRKDLRVDRRESEHLKPDRAGYTPFEASNNKLKQREDREQQYTSMYLKPQPDPKPKPQTHASPRHHCRDPLPERDPGFGSAWRPAPKPSAEKAYQSRDAYRLPGEPRPKPGRFDSEEGYLDKKKNRSVSFNLSHSNQDMTRSLFKPSIAPKSILKNKLSFEEDPKEDAVPKPHWSSQRSQLAYQPPFDKLRDSALDSFVIQPRRMADPLAEPQFKPLEDFEPYRPRSPYKLDYGRGNRASNHPPKY